MGLGIEPFSLLWLILLQISITILQTRQIAQITDWAGNETTQLVVIQSPANKYFHFTNKKNGTDYRLSWEWNQSIGC